jgi:hypothetical protein
MKRPWVQRLIELSQDKQIIVFTHRLSLLGTVRHFADKKSMKPDVVSIRSADWGTGAYSGEIGHPIHSKSAAQSEANRPPL